jgi:CBS domain-containing protein
VLALTACLGQEVRDADGERAGRVIDLTATLGATAPSVSGVIVRRSRRSAVGYDWSDVAAFETTGVLLRRDAAPRPDEGAPEALRLARDVLDTQIVDVAGARVVRVADVALERCGGELRVAGVDVGAGALLRRLGLRRLGARCRTQAIAWDALHPASVRGHLLALDTPGAAVHRLRGAELAQVAASLPPARAAEVLRAVGPARAAGAVAAAHSRAAGRLLAELDVEEAAPIVSAMAPDDAAAALRTIESPARADLLAELDAQRRDELARLLAHRPESAAGLMSTDVRTAPAGASRDEVRARLTARPPRLEGLATVFLLDGDGRPTGTLTPLDLVVGAARPAPALTLPATAPVDDVLDLFARHDVLAVGVVDDAGRLIGAVAIDDVLEELLAERLPGERPDGIAAVRRHAA